VYIKEITPSWIATENYFVSSACLFRQSSSYYMKLILKFHTRQFEIKKLTDLLYFIFHREKYEVLYYFYVLLNEYLLNVQPNSLRSMFTFGFQSSLLFSLSGIGYS
jgi:hypothetical protein